MTESIKNVFNRVCDELEKELAQLEDDDEHTIIDDIDCQLLKIVMNPGINTIDKIIDSAIDKISAKYNIEI